jgi:hypothetical protein
MITSSGRNRWLTLMTMLAVTGTAVACSDVTDVPNGLHPQAAIDDPSDTFDGTDNTKAYVCVVSPVAGTYTYDISGVGVGGNPGPNISNDPADVAPGTCEEVATAGAGAGFLDADSVTADETAAPATAVLDSVIVEDAKFSNQGAITTYIGSDFSSQGDPATGIIGNERATRITYYYSLVPDEGGDEGCTPGYWKQEQHFDSWVGYTQNQTLESVFDVPDAYGLDSTTLLAALSLQGGPGVNGAARNLMRAAVAALLNSTGVDYTMTSAEVIAAVNAALASGDRDTMLALAADLDADNNLGCPLN